MQEEKHDGKRHADRPDVVARHDERGERAHITSRTVASATVRRHSSSHRRRAASFRFLARFRFCAFVR